MVTQWDRIFEIRVVPKKSWIFGYHNEKLSIMLQMPLLLDSVVSHGSYICLHNMQASLSSFSIEKYCLVPPSPA